MTHPIDIASAHTREECDDCSKLIGRTQALYWARCCHCIQHIVCGLLLRCAAFRQATWRLVSILDGRTALTVTPSCATSIESAFKMPWSPARAAVDTPICKMGCLAAIDVMAMIRPNFCRRIAGLSSGKGGALIPYVVQYRREARRASLIVASQGDRRHSTQQYLRLGQNHAVFHLEGI